MVAPPSTGPGGSASGLPVGKPKDPARMSAPIPPQMPPPIPYSARRAAALDLKTVERKGHPSSRHSPARSRPHGLPEAPTFRPTDVEFRDPMAYLQSIYEQASKHGICKIIPPEGWNPDFAVDTERFHFRTRRQTINETDGGNRTNLQYLDQLAKFHRQYGTQLNRFPSVDKRPLDLYKLKKAVEVRGGFEKVCKDKKWAEIGRDLGYSGKIMSSLSTSLKNSYQRWLHPYESWLTASKNGGQPMDFEYHTAAFSPSVSQHQSPMQHPHSQSAPPTESPAVQASIALNSSVHPQDQSMQSSQMPHQPPPRPISSSGFTAVNSGGFPAVNQPGGFVAVNQQPPPPIKSEAGTSMPAAPVYGNGFQAVNGAPTPYRMPDGSPIANGVSNPLKRTMSHESLNGESGSDGLDEQGRRSKRPRKEGGPIPGNHIPAMRPSTPQTKARSTSRKNGDKCERCGKSEDQSNIMVCESCELGYHRYCVDPPLPTMPDFEWNCSKCLIGSNDYGFEEGGVYSLKVFQEKANNFKEHYFATRMPFDPVTGTNRRPSEDDVEREFWRLVEDITESVEVEYGADIHSTTHGSGFPTVEKNPLNPYSRDPWNLNVMPFLEESLFRHIKGDISGMTVPWLYVGMCFSTFCWHNEDHYAYSANYQHFGATKTWYGIPGKDAHAFEAAMRKAVPELFESQPDLLFQLVTILPPDQLRKAGVEVYVLDQRAGEFVITFPQAYHAGFNHGFNFNEAVNFAPADWEPFGEAGVQRLREFRKQPCFSHDELLFTAAGADTSIKTARWLAPALLRSRDRELAERDSFVEKHKALHPHPDCAYDTLAPEPPSECGLIITVEDKELQEEEYQCHYCKAYTFLSQFRCHSSGKVSCLLHPEVMDCCGEPPEQRLRGSTHSLVVRLANSELEDLVQKVSDKAGVPEAWETRLENLLEDEPLPPLRTLQTLLSEGEKIPFPLAGLDDLSEFVKECNAWVDEANLYTTRGSRQNRRKSEKAMRRSSAKGKDGDKDDSQLTLERMKKLIEDGQKLGFSAPQLDLLIEKLRTMDDWRLKAKPLCSGRSQASLEELAAMLEEGRGFMAAMPELTGLEKLHNRQRWYEQVDTIRRDMSNQTLDECKSILEQANELDIDPRAHDICFMTDIVRQGDFWETKAKEVMSAEDVHYPQLESLHTQVQNHTFPVNKDTLAQMDAILAKNREAKRQIITLVERSHDPDFRKRPFYVHVRDVVKGLEDLNGKPHGTADLEKELRRHEDWMRKGKKLFGKANAPLHILEQHMKFVEEKNSFCFDLNDTFRPPVEPASREASPAEGQEKGHLGDDEKPVFCICRQPEAGLMIECEICHDWYHAKCLKLARGKVKETEMFTCPICDWRVKIPRDAARPKLEDLQAWQDELAELPFQPEEEELLRRIVDKAQGFRDFLGNYTNGTQICRTIEEMPEMLFYLRKIEGAEVLLAYETNLFRQELHKWQPIAPEPPPILNASLSTRKPRPTKQQKLMKELGVEKPEDLPPHLRTKTYTRRKTQDAFAPPGTLMPKPSTQSPAPGSASSPGPSQQGQGRSATPAGMPRTASTGNVPTNGAFGAGVIGGTNPDTSFDNDYASGAPEPFAANPPSPMFSPTQEARPIMTGGLAEGRSNDGGHDPSFPTFRPSLGLDGDDDIRNGLANAENPGVGASPGPPPPASEYDSMFMEMTDPDREVDAEVTNANEPVPNLEHEASHASEALEMMTSNGGGDEDVGLEDDESVEKQFDDFLSGAGGEQE
ncbi:uncharacterized protein HMPREF1541_08981 [Cyphellophora europaea CBS 101466]|uniref:Uncharacterized protein n=1 Tax=Cyphellophora europaea (strain CBS 101466) TaxID=1220924 RepID=W2RLW6_CYPE1|nr:uncharacterized protein HMPREF1541_08981 [Cyphellophora europaea CBS 101466]ETN36703.1 hypothetical protein HMPREF1541_08981 [Cyphellophora europaea CBS 101466]